MIDLCHCGCHVTSHFLHVDGKRGQCLRAICNVTSDDWYVTSVQSPCPHYRDSEKADTYKPPVVRPNHHDDCE